MTQHSALACPSCQAPMTRHRFPRKLMGEVELDLCFHCQGIWFDEFESLQIAPGGVVELFGLIYDHRDDDRTPVADVLCCPRCRERLLHGLDRVKSGSFNYHYCLQRHGRFTSFAQFMIEKGFVRQLSGAEIAALKARIGVVRCTGCGAPVDIRREAACGHCRAPLAILDPQAVERALAGYRQAEIRSKTLDPQGLADAILMTERDRSRRQRERGVAAGPDIGDLIVSGVEIIWRLLRA
jgi:uncharacterized protein YbaR (Trm112 family)